MCLLLYSGSGLLAVGDIREAQGNADNPAEEFRWWDGLKWCQFARSCPCAGEIRTKYDHDPRTVAALRVRGLIVYSVMEYRVSADCLAVRAELPCFLQTVSVNLPINHHLD